MGFPPPRNLCEVGSVLLIVCPGTIPRVQDVHLCESVDRCQQDSKNWNRYIFTFRRSLPGTIVLLKVVLRFGGAFTFLLVVLNFQRGSFWQARINADDDILRKTFPPFVS